MNEPVSFTAATVEAIAERVADLVLDRLAGTDSLAGPHAQKPGHRS